MKKRYMLLASMMMGLMMVGCQGSTTSTTQEDTSSVVVTQTSTGGYVDGVYQGSGVGYENGKTVVEVEITGGKIANIKVVSTEDDEEFFRMAEPILEEVVANQSTDVDAVAGATFSSTGILEAIEDALSQAK